MSFDWKSVGRMSAGLMAVVLATCGTGLAMWQSHQDRVKQKLGQSTLLPMTAGLGPELAIGPVDPDLHCVTLPAGIRLLPGHVSMETMDGRYHGPDWSVVSEHMKTGDDIHAYDNIVHAPPGMAFPGNGGGFVVLRGWCLVGRIITWVE